MASSMLLTNTDESSQSVPLSSADSTGLVPLTNPIPTSSAFENNRNIVREVGTRACDVSQSYVDSSEQQSAEHSLQVGTLDVLGEGDEKTTSNTEIIRPLYKYIKDKKCLLCGFESQAKDFFTARTHLLVHITNKDFKCDICDKRFRTDQHLLRHRVLHSDVFPFSCDLCDKKYRTKPRLNNHKKKVHEQRRKWKCEICDKDFTTNVSLKEHLRLHTGERPHVCSICKEAFRVKSALKSHLRKHINSRKPNQCPQCNVIFARKADLNFHDCNPGSVGYAPSTSSIVSSTLKSNIVGAELPSQSISLPSTDSTCSIPLTRSLSTSSGFESNRNVDGEVCTQQCAVPQCNVDSSEEGRSEDTLQTGTFDFLDESDERSTSNRELIRPLYKYIENKKCLLCGFESQAKDAFSARSHLLVHVMNKDFKCDICDKRFATEKYMLRHRVLHSDVFPFSCDLCDKRYRTKSRLHNHKKKVHEQRRKWKCEVCDKDFTTNVSLKEHLRLHTGERPHVCPVCKVAFRVKSVLTNHLRRHYRTRKPHRCPLCKVTFIKKSDLNYHECSPGSHDFTSPSMMVSSTFKGNIDRAEPSNQSISSPSSDSTCLVPLGNSSVSTAWEKDRNIDGTLDRNECDESQLNVDCAGEMKIASTLPKDTFDGLIKFDKKCTINSKVIRPLYKYIRDKKCLLCGFESKAKEFFSARTHLLVHITNKDFKCDICGRKFATEKYMLKHRVVHSDVFPFSCDLCNKKFQARSRLYNHRRRTHGQKRK